MRSKLFILWAGFRGLLLILVIVTAVEAPAVVLPLQPDRPIRVWEGLSSWYGEKFHGRLTANGEIYDMYAPTAAHPTLPLGSLVRLVNPKTGRSRLVRINDRGPVIEGREIDVSYEVARSLGFEEQGLARLRIELLEVPKKPWRETHTKD
ncbi:MAG: septal ring lytic transglycosylase RlpA family protein [Acidobacteria bacterium]|nr:septal ring lytic transglycosylase RlpA family protein [Acidobacteriota bacterium]